MAPDVEEVACALYRDGLSSRQTAKRLDLSQRTVMRILRRCGVATRDQVTAQTVVKDTAEIVAPYRSGLSLKKVADRFGVDSSSVRNALDRAGEPRRKREDYRRERSAAWRGGRIRHQEGYILVYAPDHPRATPNGYVREHIVVMEKALGGPLPEGAEIHHKNGIKSDNSLDNLVVLTKADHARLHAALKRARRTEAPRIEKRDS